MTPEVRDAIVQVEARVPHAFWTTPNAGQTVLFYFSTSREPDYVPLVHVGREDLGEAHIALDIERCVAALEAQWAALNPTVRPDPHPELEDEADEEDDAPPPSDPEAPESALGPDDSGAAADPELGPEPQETAPEPAPAPVAEEPAPDADPAPAEPAPEAPAEPAPEAAAG